MIKVQGDYFYMGSPVSEMGRFKDEIEHKVTLTKAYWLGETEVTQGQWKAVMGNNPSHFQKGDDYPVESVSWGAAMAFCKKMNETFLLPQGYTFSLPTEAQWEFACRASTDPISSKTALNNGRNLTSEKGYCYNLNEVGWYFENSSKSTHPVKGKKANAWGFYDMHGNVQEWCSDWYDSSYGCNNKDVTDPEGPSYGPSRVTRGGSWKHAPMCCRSASRSIFNFSLDKDDHSCFGFRLAIVPVQ